MTFYVSRVFSPQEHFPWCHELNFDTSKSTHQEYFLLCFCSNAKLYPIGGIHIVFIATIPWTDLIFSVDKIRSEGSLSSREQGKCALSGVKALNIFDRLTWVLNKAWQLDEGNHKASMTKSATRMMVSGSDQASALPIIHSYFVL